ncbi:MAG: AAA domain-containing protein, partial [Planctomycetota bacterium]
APTETLQITDTWAIYARPRSDNLFFEDIERLKRIVEDSDFESLQTAARQFVADPSDQPTYQPQRIDLLGKPRGKVAENKAREQPVDDFDLFFPKEYNDAQVKIIHELERSDGVVVQGPPGTGKTHTIANIICHYLATGRRVLVTSQGEPALKVLRQFIPEEIRRLTISLLTKDQEGLQQLETAVTLLANEVTRIVPEQIEKQIIDSEQKLRDLRAQLDKNEQAVRDIAERQLTPRQHELFGDSPCSPSELAQNLAGDRSQHEWLPDTPGLDPAFEPQFTAADVAAAGQARRRLGADLQYLSSKLPTIKNLPDNSKLQEIHQRIIDADQNDPHAQDPDFPKLSVLAEDARERATALIDDPWLRPIPGSRSCSRPGSSSASTHRRQSRSTSWCPASKAWPIGSRSSKPGRFRCLTSESTWTRSWRPSNALPGSVARSAPWRSGRHSRRSCLPRSRSTVSRRPTPKAGNMSRPTSSSVTMPTQLRAAGTPSPSSSRYRWSTRPAQQPPGRSPSTST